MSHRNFFLAEYMAVWEMGYIYMFGNTWHLLANVTMRWHICRVVHMHFIYQRNFHWPSCCILLYEWFVLNCSFRIHSDWHNNETMSEKTCWLLASYHWLLYIYPHLMVSYMLSKVYTSFTPFPVLSLFWRGGADFQWLMEWPSCIQRKLIDISGSTIYEKVWVLSPSLHLLTLQLWVFFFVFLRGLML